MTKLESNEINENISRFGKLMDKAKKPCPEDDCAEVLSPCCGGILTTVFGTLPLLVQCLDCKKLYVFRDLL